MQKDEKTKIKKILKVVLPDLFGLDAVELSDDEDGGDGNSFLFVTIKFFKIDFLFRRHRRKKFERRRNGKRRASATRTTTTKWRRFLIKGQNRES